MKGLNARFRDIIMFDKCKICPYSYCALHFGERCCADDDIVIKDAIDNFIRIYNQRENGSGASFILFFKRI